MLLERACPPCSFDSGADLKLVAKSIILVPHLGRYRHISSSKQTSVLSFMSRHWTGDFISPNWMKKGLRKCQAAKAALLCLGNLKPLTVTLNQQLNTTGTVPFTSLHHYFAALPQTLLCHTGITKSPPEVVFVVHRMEM